MSFNTVNGRCYFHITFVLPSLRSGTCNVSASSPLRSSAASHSAAHTVNSRCCHNQKYFRNDILSTSSFNTVNGKRCCNSHKAIKLGAKNTLRFNTVNGRHCCNVHRVFHFRIATSGFQYRKR